MSGILQIVHGMAEYILRYEELAQFLAERGILVTGDDHLGHGKSVPEEESADISVTRIRPRWW